MIDQVMTINSVQKSSKSELSAGGKRPFKVSFQSNKKSIKLEPPLVRTNEPVYETGVPICMFTNSTMFLDVVRGSRSTGQPD